MSKVYVLVDEWKRDYEGETTVIGVFQDRKDAEKALATQITQIGENHFDTIDQVEGDYYDAYNEGGYAESHDHIFIQETELK